MKKIISIITLAFILSGCSIYRAEVQQGNALNDEAVSQLQRGMSKAQVTALLGTPLLQDNFRANRWDYIYFDGTRGQLANKQDLVLLFSNDQLTQITK